MRMHEALQKEEQISAAQAQIDSKVQGPGYTDLKLMQAKEDILDTSEDVATEESTETPGSAGGHLLRQSH